MDSLATGINIMAKPVKPPGARHMYLKLNARLDGYLTAGQAVLSLEDKLDRRGFNSKVVRAAVSRWSRALEAGERMTDDRLRLYLLEYLDAVYVTRTRQFKVYLDEETIGQIDAIADRIRGKSPPPLLERLGVTERSVIVAVALCRLADALGKHLPLVEGDC